MKKIDQYWKRYLELREEVYLKKKEFEKKFKLQDIPEEKREKYKKAYLELLNNLEGWKVALMGYTTFFDYVLRKERRGYVEPLWDKIKDLQIKIGKEIQKEGYSKPRVFKIFLSREKYKYVRYMGEKGYSEFVKRYKSQKERENKNRKWKRKYHKRIKLNYHYCLLCRKRKNLQQHHIYIYENDVKKHNSPENVVWLCKMCHLDKAHQGDYSGQSYFPEFKKMNGKKVEITSEERKRKMKKEHWYAECLTKLNPYSKNKKREKGL